MKSRISTLALNALANFRSGRLAALLGILLLAGSISLHFWHRGSEESSFEEEEGEGIPGIMKAMDLWSNMRTYPHTEMEAREYSASYERTKSMKIQRNSPLFSQMSGNWTPLGPLNFSGRILCLGFHPTNSNIIFAGSASGGLWKTTTGGTGAPGGINWQYVPTGFPVLAVASIAINPTNPNEMYIGTGEVYNNAAAASGPTGAGHVRVYRGSYGIGILKSTDGGVTWTKSLDFSYSNLKGVADMVIDPTNTNIVYAATSDGLYRSSDAGATWSLVPGVPVMAQDLCYKPGDHNTLYVGCGDFTPSTSGIFKSTNAGTAGTPTFTKLTSGLPTGISGKIQLSISPNNPSKIYASIGADPNVPSDPEGLWVSTNDGASWSQPGASNIIGNQGWYAHDIAADVSNANKVYWGELDLYLSTNGGSSSFSKKSSWSQWNINNKTIGTTQEGTTTTYVHADIHRIYCTAGNTIWMCTDGGIFKSTNGASSFITLNGGLQTSQIYANMSISQTDPNLMLGGLQDNEAFVYEGSPGCRRIGNLGDGFHTAIDPSNDNNCFVASYYLNVKKSTNRASTFPTSSINLNGGSAPTEPVCFNAPYVICPSNPSVMYAGSYRIRKSTNQGGSWSVVTGALSTSTTDIIYIEPAPSNENIVFVSVAPESGVRSKLFKTTNGFSSYSEVTGTLPDRYYSDIAVDPSDPNRVAVTLSGFGSSHLFISYDGGANWSDAGSGLPDAPANTVMWNPNNTSQIYVGTDLGVYFANNVPSSSPGSTTSLTWTAYNEGFNDAIMVSDLLMAPNNMIRLASYGRGLWERALAPMGSLPVNFNEFVVSSDQRGNNLEWTVSQQTNVSHYEAEYSTDGIHFSRLASIPVKSGSGNISYSYYHKTGHTTDDYYRIKSVDQDGKYEYSVIRMVKASNLAPAFVVYPNPTDGRFRIQVPAQQPQTATIQVFAADGRLVMETKAGLQQGSNTVSMDISSLPAGMYRVACYVDNKKSVMNIIRR